MSYLSPKFSTTGGVPAMKLGTLETWGFAADDGVGGLVLSGVDGANNVWITRVSDPLVPANLTGALWVNLAPGVATDMWHIYAFGFHWITYSNKGTDQLTLLVVRPDAVFTAASVVRSVLVIDPTGAGLVPPGPYVTNDHFSVTSTARAGNIVIGVWIPSAHVMSMVHVDSSGALGTIVDVDDRGQIVNGASAAMSAAMATLRVLDVNRLVAPTAMDPAAAGLLGLHEYDGSWATRLGGRILLQDSTGSTNYSMATEALFPGVLNDYTLLTYRKITPLATGTSDYGYISRTLFNDTTEAVETPEEELNLDSSGAPIANAARPHTLVWRKPKDNRRLAHDTYVVTLWCYQDSEGVHQKIQIDLVSK